MIAALAELTLLLALAWMLDRLTIARLRPQIRHALWTVVAIRLLLPAGVTGVAPATVAIDAAPVATVAAALDGLPSEWIWAVWVAGAAMLLGRWWWQALALRRRLHALDPDEDPEFAGLVAAVRGTADHIGLRRMPLISVDPAASSPYVTGLWSPRLVLPAQWRTWSAATMHHALAHELTHLARRDLQTEAVWMLIACAYWFHPLVHLARRGAHDAREMCCDADAAARLGPGYRLALLHALAASAGEMIPAHAAPSGHAWHPAIARLHSLDRWHGPSTWRQRVALAALVLAAAAVVLPAHLSVSPRAASAALEELIDPAVRQERGLGSLHLRYALLSAEGARQRE